MSAFHPLQKGSSDDTGGRAFISSFIESIPACGRRRTVLARSPVPVRRQIRIGASETTLHYFLLPYLEQFRAAYPHIRLKISNTTTPAALHALREHAIDFAVIIAPVADDSIEIHELLEIRDIFIAGPQFSQLKDTPLHLSDLNTYPIVSMEPGTGTREHLEHIFASFGCHLTPDIELATTDLITPMVSHNLGNRVCTLFFRGKQPEQWLCLSAEYRRSDSKTVYLHCCKQRISIICGSWENGGAAGSNMILLEKSLFKNYTVTKDITWIFIRKEGFP